MDDVPDLGTHEKYDIPPSEPFLHHITCFLEALEAHHLSVAQSHLDEMVSFSPSASLGYYCSGLLLLALHEPAKAVSSLKKAVENTIDDENYYEFVEALAIVCARLGRHADALYYGKLAPSFDPHPSIPNLLPTWLGKFEKALLGKHTLKATTQDWFRSGQNKRAISSLVDLLAFDPHHAETWTEIIRFLEKEERHADMIACFLALKDIRPLDAEETCLLAYVLGKNNQLAKAFDYLLPLIENNHPSAMRIHHLLFVEIGLAGFGHHPKPALLAIPKDKATTGEERKLAIRRGFRKIASKPFKIALMAGNWHPFGLPSLVAPLFYLPRRALESDRDIQVSLVDLSPQKTLHLSFLKNRFKTVIQGTVGSQVIEAQTFATILHHSDIDLLVDLDGVASLCSLYHYRNPAPAPVIAPLIRSSYALDNNPHLYPLTDNIIHPDVSKTQAFTPLSNHSLFCLDNAQAITKAPSPPFPFTIGLLASPCHLHPLHPLFMLLQKLDTSLEPIRLLFYTPTSGGVPATASIAEAIAFTKAEVTFSSLDVSVTDFCKSCHVIIDATPTITGCYPHAALKQSIPVLHLKLPNEPAITASLLHAFHRKEWSFSSSDNLINLLKNWQDNPSTYQEERERFFQQQQDFFNESHLCKEHLYHIAQTYQDIYQTASVNF